MCISKSLPVLSPRGWLLFCAGSSGFAWLSSSGDNGAWPMTCSLVDVVGSSPRPAVEIAAVSGGGELSRSGGLEV